MQLKEINTWWKRETQKAQLRHSNAPKAPAKRPFLVPEDISEFAPKPVGFKGKKLHAR
jgi:hypothetical protein